MIFKDDWLYDAIKSWSLKNIVYPLGFGNEAKRSH